MALWHVQSVRVLPGFRLEVLFADGASGIVDLSKDRFTGVLAPLSDPALFSLARVGDGAVTWPGGLELAPDAMYAEVTKQAVSV